MIVPGFTFLSPTPSSPVEHLYIVLSPIIDGKVLLVNVTTPKYNSDLSCVLKESEHPFLTHDSIINYADATDTDVDKIKQAITMNVFKPHASLSEDLLQRVQKGALASTALKPRFRKYIPPPKPD